MANLSGLNIGQPPVYSNLVFPVSNSCIMSDFLIIFCRFRSAHSNQAVVTFRQQVCEMSTDDFQSLVGRAPAHPGVFLQFFRRCLLSKPALPIFKNFPASDLRSPTADDSLPRYYCNQSTRPSRSR